MGKHWEKQKLDLSIMKILYEFKAVRGKTLVDMFSEYKQQTIYDRLRELKRMKLIDREPYNGLEAGNQRRKRPRMLGKVYYLTRFGVEQVKIHVYNAEITGQEKSQRPEDKDIENHWRISVLISNLDFPLIPSAIHKQQQEYPKNLMIDLGCQDWSITFVRNNQEGFRYKLLQLARILELRGGKKTIFLCSTRPQHMSLVKHLTNNHVKGTYVLMQDDYANINWLLAETFELDAVRTLQDKYGTEVEKLDSSVNGCNYRIAGEYTNIYSILGYPAGTMRRLSNPVTLPGYVIVADEQQYKQVKKNYPEYFSKYHVIIAEKYSHTELEEEIPKENKTYEDWGALIDLDSLDSDVGSD